MRSAAGESSDHALPDPFLEELLAVAVLRRVGRLDTAAIGQHRERAELRDSGLPVGPGAVRHGGSVDIDPHRLLGVSPLPFRAVSAEIGIHLLSLGVYLDAGDSRNLGPLLRSP